MAREQAWMDLVAGLLGDGRGAAVFAVLVVAVVFSGIRLMSRAKRFRLLIEYDKTDE